MWTFGPWWSSCPGRICDRCYRKGHDTSQYRVDYENRWDEGSATITVNIEDKRTRALLDTGARVNVMDVSTMRDLGLDVLQGMFSEFVMHLSRSWVTWTSQSKSQANRPIQREFKYSKEKIRLFCLDANSCIGWTA